MYVKLEHVFTHGSAVFPAGLCQPDWIQLASRETWQISWLLFFFQTLFDSISVAGKPIIVERSQ